MSNLIARSNTIVVSLVANSSAAITILEKESSITDQSFYVITINKVEVGSFNAGSGKISYLTLGQMLREAYASSSSCIADCMLRNKKSGINIWKSEIKELNRLLNNKMIRALQDTYFTEA